MKKTLLALAFILVCVLSATAFAADPIKIGYLASMTGDHAAYGMTEVNMARMIVGEVNAKGGVLGRQIQLIPYDSKSRPEDSVNAVRRMIENDKVVAIIGTNFSGLNIATAPIVNRAEVPMIATVATNLLVTVDEAGKVRPYSFRICFTDPAQGQIAAELAINTLKRTKAAILYNVGSDYAHGLREYFVKSFTEGKGDIVADEGYRDSDVDFRAQLTKVKNSNANVMFLPGMGKDMALIIKQSRELGMKDIAIIGGDGYGAFMNEIAGDTMIGTYWVNHTYLNDPGMAPFFARYKETYNDECKEFVNGTMSCDAVFWLVDAIERAGKAEGPAIAKALEATKDLKLNHATLTVDPATHNPINKAGVILEVDKNLSAEFFEKVQPK